MLEIIPDLPNGVLGLRAKGKVSREDYDETLMPFLEDARKKGVRLRFLYHFGPEFDGFTAGAAWEDMRTGMTYLRRFERCAVVSDVGWLRTMSRAVAVTMPCPVRIFENAEWQAAVEWLSEPAAPKLEYRILTEKNVVVVEPKDKLRAEDFDALASSVDSWIEGACGTLQGLVIRANDIPGWRDLGSMLGHLNFVREHHRKVRRVAWVSNSTLASLAPGLANHFVAAEVRHFDSNDMDAALAWAAGGEGADRGARTAAE